MTNRPQANHSAFSNPGKILGAAKKLARQPKRWLQISYRRWSFVRGSSYKISTGKVLVFSRTGRQWEMVAYKGRSHMEVWLYSNTVSRDESNFPQDLPGLTLVTPSPTLSTVPPPSCPRITGNFPSESLPLRVWLSVWQTPVAIILMRTSPALGGATSTVSIVSGLPASQATAARQDIGCN